MRYFQGLRYALFDYILVYLNLMSELTPPPLPPAVPVLGVATYRLLQTPLHTCPSSIVVELEDNSMGELHPLLHIALDNEDPIADRGRDKRCSSSLIIYVDRIAVANGSQLLALLLCE